MAEIIDAKGLYAGPGYVDIHCHGGGSSKATADPAGMAKHHLLHGTTSITPSMVYNITKDEFLEGVRLTREAMTSPETNIVGIHYEGPFINPSYGSSSKKAWPYSRDICEEIFDAGGSDVLHCTYAPELPFAPQLEAFLRDRGVIMDLGHTEMSPAHLERAMKNGARIITHLFDAMGSWRGNDSVKITGIIQESAADVALSTVGLYYELICDYRGVHVKPANVRLALRAAGEDNIILVTDATSQWYDPADYPEDDPRSSTDLNYNEQGEVAGSLLTMEQTTRNFQRFTGAAVETVFKTASRNPAHAIGIFDRVGSLEAGKDANIILCDETMTIHSVYLRGKKVR